MSVPGSSGASGRLAGSHTARRTTPLARSISDAAETSSARGVTVTSTMPSSVVGTAASTVPAHHVDATKTSVEMRSASPTATIASSAVMPWLARASKACVASSRFRAARPSASSRLQNPNPVSTSERRASSTTSAGTSALWATSTRRGFPTTPRSASPSCAVAPTPTRMSQTPMRVASDWRRTTTGGTSGAGATAFVSSTVAASVVSSLTTVPSPRAGRPPRRRPPRTSFRKCSRDSRTPARRAADGARRGRAHARGPPGRGACRAA